MKPYRLWKRQKQGDKGKPIYYFKVPGKPWRSTGTTTRSAAEEAVVEMLRQDSDEIRSSTLRSYAQDFFVWGKCPRIQRRLDAGHKVTRKHAYNNRRWLEKYVLTDPICDLELRKVKRSDVLEFRARLRKRLGEKVNTANKTLAALKTVFKEALYRQDISMDPTAGVENLKEERRKPGVFTQKELARLFNPENAFFQEAEDYAMFLLAATTGMRRGEILGLKWKYVDLETGIIRIEEAWKGWKDGQGDPKWGHRRATVIPPKTVKALEAVKERPIHMGGDGFVFCYDDGKLFGETWWSTRWRKARKAAGYGPEYKPHSLRHSINTIMTAEGVSTEKLREMLGWWDEKTRQHYTQLGPDHFAREVQKIEHIFKKS
jgi:integrase